MNLPESMLYLYPFGVLVLVVLSLRFFLWLFFCWLHGKLSYSLLSIFLLKWKKCRTTSNFYIYTESKWKENFSHFFLKLNGFKFEIEFERLEVNSFYFLYKEGKFLRLTRYLALKLCLFGFHRNFNPLIQVSLPISQKKNETNK